ncbi:uncharacterized protein LOC111348943 [Spodoptera litura]|uniref:Uncharacterized protein LOC111348943 n=1 Tax=Spodoptera litura TaxID=69820 RepID=A0A9J7DPF2_SPOLT|nr:uncharacterized protein LOC111348943 [Spodoptera litura]
MKIILLVLLSSSLILTINARLIEKITDRTLTTETKTTGSSPPVRLTREVFDEDSLIGFSREDNLQSDEYTRTYNRRARHFFKAKPNTGAPPSAIRVPRESHEKVEKVTNKNTTTSSTHPAQIKTKNTLVKKPIPKYNEMDYDDDFQMKISRSPVRVVDSGEHEDEDFNLDDYDFDVNHDEFVGRGKPLEPRTKSKETNERSQQTSVKQESKPAPAPRELKTPTNNKVHAPASHRPVSNKKERAVDSVPKNVVEKDDYYDDSTSTKAPEKEKARDMDDEFNEENEESKEFDGKSVRMIRSPWKVNAYVDNLGDKTSSVMSKVLSILPMFPQIPNKNNGEASRLRMDS